MVRIQQSKLFRYGVAVVAPIIALALSLLLPSIINRVPFILFFGALAVSAGFGGLGPGMVTALVSVLFVDYFIISPTYTLALSPQDIITLGLFIFIAFVISWVYEARQRAETNARLERERFRITLTSIGDAVIATDAQGHITFINKVAET